jgi:fumarate reductase subunit D
VKRRTPEPYLWLLFSAGGVVAALTLPVLVLIFGVLAPLGIGHPEFPAWTRWILLVVVFLCLAHAAHRLRFTLAETLRLPHRLLAPIAYGLALAGTVIAVLALI